jgi:hypothetical protein
MPKPVTSKLDGFCRPEVIGLRYEMHLAPQSIGTGSDIYEGFEALLKVYLKCILSFNLERSLAMASV